MIGTPDYLVFWEPVLGCSKVSPACLNCFADRNLLLKGLHPRYEGGIEPRLNVAELEKILTLEAEPPCEVLVTPLSDLFHEKIDEKYIFEVLSLIKRLPSHNFQISTKRSNRMMELSHRFGGFPRNVEAVVTVETPEYYYRIKDLQKTKVTYRSLNFKPLLSNLPKIPLDKINSADIAVEAHTENIRITKRKWIMDVYQQCYKRNIPCCIRDDATIAFEPVSLFYQSLIFQLVTSTNGLMTLIHQDHPGKRIFYRMICEKLNEFKRLTSHDLPKSHTEICNLMTDNPQLLRDLADYIRERNPVFFYEVG